DIDKDFICQIEFALEVMSSLYKLWIELDIAGKRMLLGSIFSDKLVFDGTTYRTPTFKDSVKELFLVTPEVCKSDKMETAAKFDSRSASVAGLGLEPRTFGL